MKIMFGILLFFAVLALFTMFMNFVSSNKNDSQDNTSIGSRKEYQKYRYWNEPCPRCEKLVDMKNET